MNKDYLERVQSELFYTQIIALKREEEELFEHFEIARNLACTEWEEGVGEKSLRMKRIVPDKTDLLHKNYAMHFEDISYRRYALIKAYQHIVQDKELKTCYDYWENKLKLSEGK